MLAATEGPRPRPPPKRHTHPARQRAPAAAAQRAPPAAAQRAPPAAAQRAPPAARKARADRRQEGSPGPPPKGTRPATRRTGTPLLSPSSTADHNGAPRRAIHTRIARRAASISAREWTPRPRPDCNARLPPERIPAAGKGCPGAGRDALTPEGTPSRRKGRPHAGRDALTPKGRPHAGRDALTPEGTPSRRKEIVRRPECRPSTDRPTSRGGTNVPDGGRRPNPGGGSWT
jgi:hypothetical protein